MKGRLNLTIDEQLIVEIKRYAGKKDIPVSELVEDFFKKVLKPGSKSSIIDMVDNLEKAEIPGDADLTELYYQKRGERYGS